MNGEHTAEIDAPTCLVCNAPAVVDVNAPVSLHGYDAPVNRHAYPAMRITLCQRHVDQYHGSVTQPGVTGDDQ